MTKDEIIEFINSNPLCNIATAENNVPHVRGVFIYRADEKGIIFHTGNMKDLYRQLNANPNVEFSFLNNDKNIQVRVAGRAVLSEDMDLKKEIVDNRPFLKPWVEKMGYDMLAVFHVADCVAHKWTLETNFAPKEYINLT